MPRSLNAAPLTLGSYPTPLLRLPANDLAHELWVKNDGHTAQLYGGNKVRKLERLLAAARGAGARRLLTVGAAGSHHVLATCLFGGSVGLPTHAVLTPQPWTAHAEATLRAGLGAGLTAAPVRSFAAAAWQLRQQQKPGDFLIGPGGFGSEGTWAYRLAIDELAAQLGAERSPPLEAIVVAAGSGSTAAGLLAGVLCTGIARSVIAVQVAPNPALRWMIVGQALHALKQRGHSVSLGAAMRALRIDARFLGAGYGHTSPKAAAAMGIARSFGLDLEPTYTAKAFASALDWAGQMGKGPSEPYKLQLPQRRTYLYWHTLSAVPLAALLEGAPPALPPELARVLRKPQR